MSEDHLEDNPDVLEAKSVDENEVLGEEQEADGSSMKLIVSNESQEDVDDSKLPVDPLLQQYHTACQSGVLATVKELIESHAIDITNDYDPIEKITGLHWASINNRLTIVKYLISQGAEVNFQAGNLNATPLHWAARYGYVYIVDYLIQSGADVNMVDEQGFNLLHLSVNSSNIMLVTYVLFFVVSKGLIDIDCVSPKGRTALLWATYQGDSLTVEMLLKFGANLKIADEEGFTALHWGVVKGQVHSLRYLIREGGDFFQKTNDGKDCFTIANELNTIYGLNEALRNCGFNKEGYPVRKIFEDPFHAKVTTFLIPLIFMGIGFNLFSRIHPMFTLMVMTVFGFAINKFLNIFVLPSYISHSDVNDPLYDINISKSPLMAGIFFGSLFWITIIWFFKLLPSMFDSKNHWANFSLFVIIVLLYIIFLRLLNSDPGVMPIDRENHNHIHDVIKELMELGSFDTENFCIETWVRKPLRSKYSKFSKGIVSRFDHFCPWIYNDVGLINHKLFLFFVLLLEAGIIIFSYLIYGYFDLLEDLFEKDYDDLKCVLLGDDALCYGYHLDKFAFIATVWSLIQAIWVSFLLFVQFFQIFKGVTNYEFNTLVRKQRKDQQVPLHNENFNTTPEELRDQSQQDAHFEQQGQETESDHIHEHSLLHMQGKFNIKTCFGIGFCFKILGLSQWVTVVKETIGINSQEMRNTRNLAIPTNYGWKHNLADFWLTSDINAPMWQRAIYSPRDSRAMLKGSEIDYFTLYDLPVKDSVTTASEDMV